jgi:hypothetical protein
MARDHGIPSVASVAALRAILNHSKDNCMLVGDPSELWVFSAISLGIDDGVTIVQPTNVGVGVAGRWIRRSGGEVTTEDAGSTADDYVNVVGHGNLHGLLGAGTLRNTHASRALTARETAIDFFGVVAVRETVLAAGEELDLDVMGEIEAGRPPYISYAVEVKSTVGATPATFKCHFVCTGQSPAIAP